MEEIAIALGIINIILWVNFMGNNMDYICRKSKDTE